MSKSANKRLYLKLGGTCNLKCKHCHCAPSVYKLNDDIFPYIEREGFERITFGGGEPLLFYDTIKTVIERLPTDIRYNFVTNGTLLTGEMVDYFNAHNCRIAFSYDGENDSRDKTYMQAWLELAKVNHIGMSTLFSADSGGAQKLFDEVTRIWRKYLNHNFSGSVWANFVHQTRKNVGDKDIDRELATDYCRFLCGQLELDFRKYRANPQQGGLNVMFMAWKRWARVSDVRGVKCFNEDFMSMTVSGDFLLCPYDPETFGNIYTGIDWEKIESRIPARCKGCPLWKSCMNTCIANVTDNECYISKVMHRHFYKLMAKYNVSYDEMAERFSTSE